MPETVEISTGALETVLNYLHNTFPVRGSAQTGDFAIVSGALTGCENYLQTGQYYVIAGSVFNDGLHRMGECDLTDETFTGTVMPCAVPVSVLQLAADIDAWRVNNPETDKTSESFGGYSYSRSGSGSASGGWTAAFAGRLAAWRKP